MILLVVGVYPQCFRRKWFLLTSHEPADLSALLIGLLLLYIADELNSRGPRELIRDVNTPPGKLQAESRPCDSHR